MTAWKKQTANDVKSNEITCYNTVRTTVFLLEMLSLCTFSFRPYSRLHAGKDQRAWWRYTQGQCPVSAVHYETVWWIRSRVRHSNMCKRAEESGSFRGHVGTRYENERLKGLLITCERITAYEESEMVHAYDHLRFKVKWEDDLRHAACAEIRASSLSGECRWAREFFTRGQWKLMQQHQECVRRRAALSVAGRPSCKDDAHAARVVNEVWDSCFADTRPFDEIYR